MKATCSINIPEYSGEEEFKAALLKCGIPRLLQGTFSLPEEMKKRFQRLVKSRNLTIFRESDVRRTVSFFCEDCIKTKVRLRFPLYLKENAYMTDAGEMAMSRLFLYSSGPERIVKVLLHEIAHCWLARQTSYTRLLALDKAYVQCSRKTGWPLSLSPTELCATVLGCEIILALSSHFDEHVNHTLRIIGKNELEMINAAITSLSL